MNAVIGARRSIETAATARPRDTAAIGLIVATFVAMVVATWPVGDFALNDDWVYALAVRGVLANGRFEILGFSSANVGPQVYWGALFCLPFGFSFTALRWSTLVLALVAAIGLYALCRLLWGDRRFAVLASLTLLVNPVFFSLANTFMTDVPFVALMIVSIGLLCAGLKDDRRRTLLHAGLALAIVGVTQRQFSLLLLVGYAAAVLCRDGLCPRVVVRAFWPLAVGAAVHAGFAQWLARTGRKSAASGITEVFPETWSSLYRTTTHETAVALLYLGLFVAPLLVFAWTALPSARRTVAHLAWPVATVVGGFAIFAVLFDRNVSMPVGGNVLAYFGIGPLALRDTLVLDTNLPTLPADVDRAWTVATVVACVGAVALLVALGRGAYGAVVAMRRAPSAPLPDALLRSPSHPHAVSALLAGFAAAYWAVLLFLGSRNHLFDRYLLPLLVVAIVAVPLASGARTRPPVIGRAGLVASVAALALLGVFSVVATRDYLEWNRLRWQAYRDLTVEARIDPHRIDAGYEINGWMLYDPRHLANDVQSWWWVDDDEYTIASDLLPGYTIERRYPFHRTLTDTDAQIVVLRRERSVGR